MEMARIEETNCEMRNEALLLRAIVIVVLPGRNVIYHGTQV